MTDTAGSSADVGRRANRLVKSAAFEMFDEDANTESPTVSQISNHDIGLLKYTLIVSKFSVFILSWCVSVW